MSDRAGIGYDLHKLVEGRKLILGGIEIPFEKGLLGHSDADVLSHAITDALLGAAALGDIGTHFPDTDPEWEGASSLELLQRVVEMITTDGYSIRNIDAVVIAERPKLGPHIGRIREALGRALRISIECISVKAKTNEGLGIVGRGEAIAAQAVVLIGK